jgi:hypothetical protein
MAQQGTVVSYPIPAYSNPPIQAQFYQPSLFDISAISLGQFTTVTTSEDHNFVIGQLVRLLIPNIFGTYQLNNTQSYVVSIPSATQVVLDLNSSNANAFIASPYIATITNITQAAQAVITANNSFHGGNNLLISDVGGMTQINGLVVSVVSATSSAITINLNTTTFTAYGSGGIAELYRVPQNQAQIFAIGDVNTGVTNTNGPTSQKTYIPGSFINISPL